MHRIVHIAVIGTGHMGRQHATAYRAIEGVQLAGVYDIDPEAAQSCAIGVGCPVFRSLGELVDARPDAVSIAVPTSQHAAIARLALKHGLHVLLETPIAATLGEASALIELAKQTGRHLMVGHIERFNPAIEALRRTVDPESIQSLEFVRLGPSARRSDIGVIIDQGIHDIDLALHLTERSVDDVFSVTSATKGFDDSASVLIRLSGGVGVQLTTSRVSPFRKRSVRIIAEQMYAHADLITRRVQICRRGQGEHPVLEDLDVGRADPMDAQLRAFIDTIRNGSPLPVTARDGVRALEAAVRASAFTHFRLQRAA